MTTSTYYKQLGVEPDATHAELETAYTRQRERYNPDRVAAMDQELRRVAEQRTVELERIYRVLSDPQRRRQYDTSIGLAPPEQQPQATLRRTLSARERWYAVGGALAALIIVAAIWVLTGRSATPQTSGVGEVNRPAPDIVLPALGGGEVRLGDYQGQVVLVNFWGTWCEPCRRELPALQSAYTALRDEGFTVIGVNLAGDERTRGNTEVEIRSFLEQYGVSYPIALDLNNDVTNAYRVFPLPTSFFIDAQGRVRYVRIGELTADDVTARFKELKQEASALRNK